MSYARRNKILIERGSSIYRNHPRISLSLLILLSLYGRWNSKETTKQQCYITSINKGTTYMYRKWSQRQVVGVTQESAWSEGAWPWVCFHTLWDECSKELLLAFWKSERKKELTRRGYMKLWHWIIGHHWTRLAGIVSMMPLGKCW